MISKYRPKIISGEIVGLFLRIYKLECILLHNTFLSATVFSFYIFIFLMFRKLNKPQLSIGDRLVRVVR
jgi:hypothetical protein